MTPQPTRPGRRDDARLWSLERLYGRTLDELPPAAVERYRFAARRLPPNAVVLDAGCGCGYGSSILAELALHVHGADSSFESIDYALEHWHGPRTTFGSIDVTDPEQWPGMRFSAIVALELLQQVSEPVKLLERFRLELDDGGLLFLSVPNEAAVPYSRAADPSAFRHWSRHDLAVALRRARFLVLNLFEQWPDGHIAVSAGGFEQGREHGPTLLAVAVAASPGRIVAGPQT